jgi:hypothetical protein
MVNQKRKKTHTIYGYNKEGTSKFVIVAPHGAGDDLKSGIIANRIAKNLNGAVVVNNQYLKPNNSRSNRADKHVRDFNRLCWSKKKKRYLWNPRPELKTFFNDIEAFCKKARKHSRDHKAVIIYIHSLKGKTIGIDLGVGLKSIKDKNKFVFNQKNISKNSGIVTIKINQVKKLKKILEDRLLADRGLKFSIGRVHSGWSKSSGIQFHKHEGRSDYALQMEISRTLRETKDDRSYIINLISETLTKVFK